MTMYLNQFMIENYSNCVRVPSQETRKQIEIKMVYIYKLPHQISSDIHILHSKYKTFELVN